MTERHWQDYQVPHVPSAVSRLWSVQKFEVPEQLEEIYREWRRGDYDKDWGKLDLLTGDPEPERHVVAGHYTKLVVMQEGYADACVMSDTQPEIEEHYPLFDASHGRVLIHGLGLGMCALACAKMDQVKSVHVLEKSKDVLALVAPHTIHPKITIERADALKWRPGRTWDCVWSDIWTFVSDSNLPDMRKLDRMYRGKCAWHGFWLRDACERRAKKLRALRSVNEIKRRFRVRPTAVQPLCRLVYALEGERE